MFVLIFPRVSFGDKNLTPCLKTRFIFLWLSICLVALFKKTEINKFRLANTAKQFVLNSRYHHHHRPPHDRHLPRLGHFWQLRDVSVAAFAVVAVVSHCTCRRPGNPCVYNDEWTNNHENGDRWLSIYQ